MKFCGLNKTTLLDYPGCVSATIFVGGCNFRCPFCHNGDLVLKSSEIRGYSEEEVLAVLEKRKNVLEGVCITGGEPTLYEKLPEFIEKVKTLGYKVKLDTNGSNPQMLCELLQNKLIDYVAMDIKASEENYYKVCGVPVDMDKIRKSVELLKEGKVSYEFRTTIVRELHTEEDILKIGEWILGAENYFLQSYQESEKNICVGFSAMEKEELLKIEKLLKNYVKNVSVRGVF